MSVTATVTLSVIATVAPPVTSTATVLVTSTAVVQVTSTVRATVTSTATVLTTSTATVLTTSTATVLVTSTAVVQVTSTATALVTSTVLVSVPASASQTPPDDLQAQHYPGRLPHRHRHRHGLPQLHHTGLQPCPDTHESMRLSGGGSNRNRKFFRAPILILATELDVAPRTDLPNRPVDRSMDNEDRSNILAESGNIYLRASWAVTEVPLVRYSYMKVFCSPIKHPDCH